ncbi:MAG: hypothetical protein MUC63_04060 [Planctomycetes bacterium]|jgi:hypothetical protein|nr:hypothetical protein [Planctomycetota bacterium]
MKSVFAAILPLLAFASLLAPLAAGADDPGREAAFARSKALLESLKGFDETLAGVQWFGAYVNGSKNIGKIRIEVTKAPEGAGAVYALRFDGSMQLGKMSNALKFEFLLDSALSVLSQTTSEENSNLAFGKRTLTAKRTDAGWTAERVVGDKRVTYTCAYAGPEHGPEPVFLVLCRKLDLKTPGEYLLRGIRWPNGVGAGKAGDTVALGDEASPEIRLSVGAPEESEFRGKATKAVRVRVEKGPRDVFFVRLDPEGRVLSMDTDDGGVSFVSGTEEEAGKDIVTAKSQEEDAVRAAVLTFFRVKYKQAGPETLDEVMDWKAVREDEAATNPAVKDLSDADYAADVKKRILEKAQEVPAAMLEQMALGIKVAIAGDTATAEGGGRRKGEPMPLKKVEGKWRLVKLPK